MSRTGTQFVTLALREIRVLDPTATASGEQLDDGLAAAADLLDYWRTQKLTMRGTTISPYTLVSGTASYTIGSGGVFNQTYPASIDLWSVVPDVTATNPIEIPRGRPYTDVEWQQIRVKTTSGQPYALYFDRAYAVGLGHALFYPVPDNSNIGVRLYQHLAAVTSLVAATTYDLAPGMQSALTLGLAMWLAARYGTGAQVSPELKENAKRVFAGFKLSNIVPKQSGIRPEFAIGQDIGRRTFNIYTGTS